MTSLQGKTAVISGAGRGIGKSIALTYAKAGADIAVLSRSEANSSSAAQEIDQAGAGTVKPYAVDVSDGASCADTGKAIIEEFGKVDILVNNAGVTRDGLSLRMSEEDWDTVLDTNLKGAFHMVKAFQRSILKQKGSSIINISSIIGLIGNAGQANYAASKAGLIGFSKSLAREFSGRGVTVNVIAPGFIQTDMTAELDEKVQDGIKERIPLGTLGSVEDISAIALFLAGESARYITGQVIAVDGGLSM